MDRQSIISVITMVTFCCFLLIYMVNNAKKTDALVENNYISPEEKEIISSKMKKFGLGCGSLERTKYGFLLIDSKTKKRFKIYIQNRP